MSEILKQQLDNLSDEDLNKILFPLNSLIQRIKNEITVYTDLNCKDKTGENTLAQNKEFYQDYIQYTLVELLESLEIRNKNVNYTIINLLYIDQISSIKKAYNKATDIKDFCGRLILLLQKLKDREMLEKLHIGDS